MARRREEVDYWDGFTRLARLGIKEMGGNSEKLSEEVAPGEDKLDGARAREMRTYLFAHREIEGFKMVPKARELTLRCADVTTRTGRFLRRVIRSVATTFFPRCKDS